MLTSMSGYGKLVVLGVIYLVTLTADLIIISCRSSTRTRLRFVAGSIVVLTALLLSAGFLAAGSSFPWGWQLPPLWAWAALGFLILLQAVFFHFFMAWPWSQTPASGPTIPEGYPTWRRGAWPVTLFVVITAFGATRSLWDTSAPTRVVTVDEVKKTSQDRDKASSKNPTPEAPSNHQTETHSVQKETVQSPGGESRASDVRTFVATTFSLILLWFTAKALLFLYFLSDGVPHYLDYENRQDGPQLLPSQRDVVNQFIEIAVRCRERNEVRVMGLHGPWGSGKTFLMKAFRHAMEEKGTPVISIDVWRHESDGDLQFAVLRRLLGHPAFLLRFFWLRFPLKIYVHPLLTALAHLPGFRLILPFRSSIALDQVVPLRWAQQLTALIRHGKKGAVFILDEIDRATPHITQSTLTLARRFLRVPGSLVIIPYVEDQIRFKAFNPFIPTYSPDLCSTNDAVLFWSLLNRPAADASKKGLDWLRENITPKLLDSNGSGETHESLEVRAMKLAKIAAQDRFLSLTPPERRRYLSWIEEKYIGGRLMAPLVTPADYGDFLKFSALVNVMLTPWKERLTGRGHAAPWDEEFERLMGDWITVRPPESRTKVGTPFRLLEQRTLAALQLLDAIPADDVTIVDVKAALVLGVAWSLGSPGF